jgi:hypothetical protein
MSNADWWASKLNGGAQTPQYRPDPTPPMPPSQQPMTPMPTLQQQQPAAGRVQSASQTQTCPECGSGNYMKPNDASLTARCFDCGYPVSQSGSRYGNLSTARVDGPARASLGNDGASNWNPQGIIGRLN